MTEKQVYDLLIKASSTKLITNLVDENNSNNYHHVTRGYNTIKWFKKNRHCFKKTTINIDNNIIFVDEYLNSNKPGYLGYYYYSMLNHNDGFVDNILTFNIYLSVNDVLNGEVYYTTNKLERRRVKIEKIKELIKKKKYGIQKI